ATRAWSLTIETDLVIVTAPKPAGSSTTISPCGLVNSKAAAKLRHGEPKLQSLLSEPDPETNVRLPSPSASAGLASATAMAATTGAMSCFIRTVSCFSCGCGILLLPDRGQAAAIVGVDDVIVAKRLQRAAVIEAMSHVAGQNRLRNISGARAAHS